jgi:hypothetical protein
MEKQKETEPTIDEVNQYQMIITEQIDTLTNTYETIEDFALQLKIKAKISELIDYM